MRGGFDLWRACFYLLAVMLLLEIGSTILAGFACYNLNLQTRQEIGACLPIVEQIRQVWAEALAAILALLLAAKGGKNGD
jgi:hypothetical protein